jgi:hypothetical protein
MDTTISPIATSPIDWVIAHPFLFLVIAIWAFFWKGMALWRSAGLRHKYWFVSILLLNTLGIIEIIYLYFIARKYKVEFIEEK